MLHTQPFTADNGLSAGRSRSRRVKQPDELARNNTCDPLRFGSGPWASCGRTLRLTQYRFQAGPATRPRSKAASVWGGCPAAGATYEARAAVSAHDFSVAIASQ